MGRTFWKRSAELVTGFAHKYRFDPFLRTEVNIIALQAAFALSLLIIVAIISTQLYHDASSAVSQGISAALQPNTDPGAVGNFVINSLINTRSRTILYAILAVLLTTGLFTYIIARLALSPTRNALDSQKQFIGNVAHELRTPLSIVKTNMEVGLLNSKLDTDVQRTLKDTIGELDRMSDILNNLLTLSAFTRSERMEFQDVDMGAIVAGSLGTLRGLFEPKRLEIEVRTSERGIAWGNVRALEQIVMNILKNAILYSAAGGHILVTVEPVYPDIVELTVRDSGRGIARKDLFRIFEPYFRGDPSRRRDGSGSGLGLTIVSELVKLHNGKIRVRSAEGRGTTVTLLLPAGKKKNGGERAPRQNEPASEVAMDFSHNKSA